MSTGPSKRITCETLANICPGLSISCTMCGIYAPAVCGPACTFAGIYCGVSGYSCAADPADATTAAPPL